MIERLLEVFEKAGVNTSPDELADILWLAPYINLPSPQNHEDAVDTLTASDVQDLKRIETSQSPQVDFSETTNNQNKVEIPVPTIPDMSVSAYLPLQGESTKSKIGGLPFRAPSVNAFPRKIEVGRALRPLMRKVSSKTVKKFDEEETVKQAAETGYYIPRIVPDHERWFDIILLVDEWQSMIVWEKTISEFRHFLEHHGAFKQVQTWGLYTHPSSSKARLHIGTGLKAQNNPSRSPRELCDPTGRRIIVILSDCVSPIWENGEIANLLTMWEKTGIISLVQMLPQILWPRTMLFSLQEVQVRLAGSVISNSNLKILRDSVLDESRQIKGIPLPILLLDPIAIYQWAKLISGNTSIDLPAIIPAKIEDEVFTGHSGQESLSAVKTINLFRSAASTNAWQLSIFLSAVPLSLPIMRLVQQIMLPDSSMSTLAEFLLSGLIVRSNSTYPIQNSDQLRYEFIDGARELLLNNLLRGDAIKLLESTSKYIGIKTGIGTDFQAILADPSMGTTNIVLNEEALPFAKISAQVLRRLGGQYISLANNLESQTKQQNFPIGEDQKSQEVVSIPDKTERKRTPPKIKDNESKDIPLSTLNLNTENIFAIGLGGTGVKTLESLKQMLLTAYGSLPTNIQILGIDTNVSPDRLQNSDPLINSSEYFFMGGNLESYVKNIARDYDYHSYISWFDHNYFRSQPNTNSLLNISNGSGMYRQLGRLALFYQMEGRILVNIILDKLHAIPGDNIRVIITTSLAGGTGSGIFIDIAHIVRILARDIGKRVDIIAMVVLPEAFSSTPPIIVDHAMQARSMAALRELSRFNSFTQTKIRMRYSGIRGSNILDTYTIGQSFDLVYLLGGKHLTPIDQSTIPMIASWIFEICNKKFSDFFHIINVNRYAVWRSTNKSSIYSTYYLYKIILPINAIIESHAIELALEVISSLTPLESNRDKLQNKQKQDFSLDPERIMFDSWLTSRPGVVRDIERLDSGWSERIKPLFVNEIQGRSVNDWRSLFSFKNSVRDPLTESSSMFFEQMKENQTFFYNTNARFLRSPLDGALIPAISRRQVGGSTREAAFVLHENCKDIAEKHFSNWKRMLRDLEAEHIQEFQEQLIRFAENILNGVDINRLETPPGKASRLIWLISYLNTLQRKFNILIDVLQTALRNSEISINEIETDFYYESKLMLDMQKNESYQKDYLRRRQAWLMLKRWHMLCNSEFQLVKLMHQVSNDLLNGLENNKKTLQDIASILLNVNIKNRHRMSPDENTEYIYDNQWENLQYKRIINALPNNPSNWIKWKLYRVKRPDPSIPFCDPVMRVEDISGEESNRLSTIEFNQADSQSNDAVRNSNLILDRCRYHLRAAWNNVTILDYLEQKTYGTTEAYTSQSLARRISEQIRLSTGEVKRNRDTSKVMVVMGPDRGENSSVISSFMEYLRISELDNSTRQNYITHVDRSSLTCIIMEDGLDLLNLDSYVQGAQHYLSLPIRSRGTEVNRRLLHVFSAEQSSTEFDKLSPDLHITSSRITNLFESPYLLEDFIMGLALGVIKREPAKDIQGNFNKPIFQVTQIDYNKLRATSQDINQWWLNDPSDYSQDPEILLIAAETYCLGQHDLSAEKKDLAELREYVRKITIEENQNTIDDKSLSNTNSEFYRNLIVSLNNYSKTSRKELNNRQETSESNEFIRVIITLVENKFKASS